jgi:hypothetical protein
MVGGEQFELGFADTIDFSNVISVLPYDFQRSIQKQAAPERKD